MLTETLRPRLLSDVRGQGHITDILKKAAMHGQLDNYRVLLFVGPRGLGKTTTARIMAKLHNCQDTAYVQATGEPCCKCPSCLAVDSLLKSPGGDVWELDGAASGNMDAIRDILSQCPYSPTGALKKRVFIVDEAHKLSDSAKSALLKTLEEPPAHVVFILATTEGSKVPITIQSRCKVFQFKMQDANTIGNYLATIRSGDDLRAMHMLGNLAEGSFRDAVQLYDMVATSTTGDITCDDVTRVLGIPENNLVNSIMSDIFAQNSQTVMLKVKTALENGVLPDRLVFDVANTLATKTINAVEKSGVDNIKGWSIADIMEVALYIRTTASRFTGVNFGGMGASIALFMACSWQSRRSSQ